MNILANDGIPDSTILELEKNGFNVITKKVRQENLISFINSENVEVLLVRSATTVRKGLISNCPSLRIIGRGGVGMDNIDVDYAIECGIEVINTPSASSQSVAELVMTHIFNISRSVQDSNRNMKTGVFKDLKKKYSKGSEVRGKTIGIIGFGRIGQNLAKYALGCGMNVIATDLKTGDHKMITLDIANQKIEVPIKISSIDYLLLLSDYISVHVPMIGSKPLIGADEFSKMKDGVKIINASRGGVIDEDALLDSINLGKVSSAGLDVFKDEPNPREDLLDNDKISVTPHIGAATIEAQERIGQELVDKILSIYNIR
jgi:D-3-phosphoglycerate dehydrogenase